MGKMKRNKSKFQFPSVIEIVVFVISIVYTAWYLSKCFQLWCNCQKPCQGSATLVSCAHCQLFNESREHFKITICHYGFLGYIQINCTDVSFLRVSSEFFFFFLQFSFVTEAVVLCGSQHWFNQIIEAKFFPFKFWRPLPSFLTLTIISFTS